MMYLYGGAAIVVLFLVGRLVKSWNAPRVAEAQAKRKKEILDAKSERIRLRNERRKDKKQK